MLLLFVVLLHCKYVGFVRSFFIEKNQGIMQKNQRTVFIHPRIKKGVSASETPFQNQSIFNLKSFVVPPGHAPYRGSIIGGCEGSPAMGCSGIGGSGCTGFS
jgi:hypothetical protein